MACVQAEIEEGSDHRKLESNCGRSQFGLLEPGYPLADIVGRDILKAGFSQKCEKLFDHTAVRSSRFFGTRPIAKLLDE
jgi:hypothetical protein